MTLTDAMVDKALWAHKLPSGLQRDYTVRRALDKSSYEALYIEGDVISDDSIHIFARRLNRDDAADECKKAEAAWRIRSALSAILPDIEKAVKERCAKVVEDSEMDPSEKIYRIAAALRSLDTEDA